MRPHRNFKHVTDRRATSNSAVVSYQLVIIFLLLAVTVYQAFTVQQLNNALHHLQLQKSCVDEQSSAALATDSTTSSKSSENYTIATASLDSNIMPSSVILLAGSNSVEKVEPVIEGVAVTTFLGSPKWYQNRYTMMINQVLAVLPESWIVQIIYHPAKRMAVEGISYPGIRRQIRRGRVNVTAIPLHLHKYKKNELLLTSWFWKNLLSENVLLFGGNAVLCANTRFEISDFVGRYDIIGAPWGQFADRGGAAGLSLRNRTVMLEIVKEQELKGMVLKSGGVKEEVIFMRALNQRHNARLATREDTLRFAMIDQFVAGEPLGSVGTLGGFPDQQRQQLIDYCPETKMMFPSLHSPHCFGAEPNAIECFKYLCRNAGMKCWRRDSKLTFTDKKNIEVTLSINIKQPQ